MGRLKETPLKLSKPRLLFKCIPFILTSFILLLPTSSATIEWVPASKAKLKEQEPAGLQNKTGVSYYVGRAEWNGGVILGYYTTTSGNLWFGHDSIEKIVQGNDRVQVLTYKPPDILWVKKTHGSAEYPFDIILGGLHPDTRNHLHPCRGTHEDSAGLVGWLDFDKDKCTIGYRGKSLEKEEYEILTLGKPEEKPKEKIPPKKKKPQNVDFVPKKKAPIPT